MKFEQVATTYSYAMKSDQLALLLKYNQVFLFPEPDKAFFLSLSNPIKQREKVKPKHKKLPLLSQPQLSCL